MKKLDFLKISFRDYRVATILPTGKYVISKVLANLKPTDKYIIEYGAGEGVFTRRILSKLPHDGKIVAIEINDFLLVELSKIVDPRLTVVKGDVLELSGRLSSFKLPRIDAVISGIPFSYFKKEDRERITENTFNFLSPGGRFIVYQVSSLMEKVIKRIFGNIKSSLELRNLPPCVVMSGVKSSG